MQDWDDAERVRQRLAHRLHDGAIQELTAAQLFLDGVAMRMADSTVEQAIRDGLERGLAALRNATRECRTLMDSLRPGLDGEGELEDRLRRVFGDIDAVDSLQISAPESFGREQPVAALLLYRAAEELAEMSRHSDVEFAACVITADQVTAQLQVQARTGQFSAEHESLTSLRARIERIGGTVQLDDSLQTINVAVPLTPRA